MIQRCTNPNNDNYSSYGGRGIKVCPQWLDFDNFYADMGERPSLEYSIERIDNDKDYEPMNCIWATAKDQANNRRIFKNNSSGYNGVGRYRKTSKWYSTITVNGKRIYLGSFNKKSDAIKARKEAEQNHQKWSS